MHLPTGMQKNISKLQRNLCLLLKHTGCFAHLFWLQPPPTSSSPELHSFICSLSAWSALRYVSLVISAWRTRRRHVFLDTGWLNYFRLINSRIPRGGTEDDPCALGLVLLRHLWSVWSTSPPTCDRPSLTLSLAFSYAPVEGHKLGMEHILFIMSCYINTLPLIRGSIRRLSQ